MLLSLRNQNIRGTLHYKSNRCLWRPFDSCASPKLEKNTHWERQLASVQPHTKNRIAYQRNNKMTHHRQQTMERVNNAILTSCYSLLSVR